MENAPQSGTSLFIPFTERLRWGSHLTRKEEGRSAMKDLTGKPIGKRPLGRPKRRWKDNIRMELKEIGINTRNWNDSAQDGETFANKNIKYILTALFLF